MAKPMKRNICGSLNHLMRFCPNPLRIRQAVHALELRDPDEAESVGGSVMLENPGVEEVADEEFIPEVASIVVASLDDAKYMHRNHVTYPKERLISGA